MIERAQVKERLLAGREEVGKNLNDQTLSKSVHARARKTHLNPVFCQLGRHVHGGPHPALVPLSGLRVEGKTEIDNLRSAEGRMPRAEV